MVRQNKLLRWALLLIALCGVLWMCGAQAEEANLLVNGDFEILDEDGLPEGWYTDAYIRDVGYTVFSVAESEGSTVASIHNIALNDARFAQIVPVEPETLYRLSADVWADQLSEGHGANLSIEGVYTFSEEIFDTQGDWQHIEWYGETGSDQQYVTIFVRVGGYSGETQGRAMFDNVSLVEVNAVPGDAIASRWFKAETVVFQDEEEMEQMAGSAWPWLVLLAVLYTLICLGILFSSAKKQGGELTAPTPWERLVIPALLLSLALRLALSWFIEGYMVDVNCFVSWGNTMANVGPTRFYLETSFCDYPPAYTWVLGADALLCRWLNASAGLTRVIFRLIPSLCDVAGCLVLYAAGKRLMASSRREELAKAVILFAFSPITILNSAAWGQMDSVLCLLLLLVALLAMEDRWRAVFPVYMLAVLVKPQALMLGFLGLAAFLPAWRTKPALRKHMLQGLGLMVLVLLAVAIPFSIGQKPDWLISLYGSTLSSYPYATVNTANLYYLLGGNWSGISTSAGWLACLCLALVCGGYGFIWYRRAGTRYGKPWVESGLCGLLVLWFLLCAILGWSWAYVGTAAMVFAFLVVLSLYLRKGDVHFLPFAGGLLFLLLYVFGVKMHERYLFPALLLFLTAWIMHRDRRILYVLLCVSCTMFINEGIVLDNSIRLGSSLGHLNADTTWLADLCALVNVLAALYACWVGISLTLGEAPAPLTVRSSTAYAGSTGTARSPLHYHPDHTLQWKKRDTLILTAITVCYAAVSLCSLGSTKAPQTAWTSSGYDEYVIFDLGEHEEPVTILYFARVSRYNFTFAVSNDGETWSEETYAQMDQGQCWKWKYVTNSYENASGERKFYNSTLEDVIRFSGRYIRLHANQIGLTLCEVIFRTVEGKILPVREITHIGGNEESVLYSDPALMLDEPDTLEGLPSLFQGTGETSDIPQPSWWNSTYFDEIYHARTAYEFLQGTTPYETTHPPLGKLLMSVCVALLGMTPFGWRLAGALAGIAMLPGMYLLGKQLTKKTWVGALCCGLMALDCLHLTQTQIATIDSFPVLFILFSYFFMLRFLQMNILTEKTKTMCVNLGLSGLFMGLSIASKWIGIYAGLGLAVLFFWHLIRHMTLCRAADSMPASPELAPYQTRNAKGWRLSTAVALRLCLWCVLFFVIIPLAIYLLCYIPYMAYRTDIHSLGAYLQAVYQSQLGMLNYHSQPGLGMNHPFYSPWWQWPIIGKPMYYASEQYLPNNGLHTSIFAFGNPVVWYGGLAGLLACLVLWLRGKHYRVPNASQTWHWTRADFDGRYAFLLLGFLAQYLPWVLVPRGTYIYHYFASVPFLIVAIALGLDALEERTHRIAVAAAGGITLLAFLGFCLFFPYASGILAPKEWMDLGKSILHIYY